MKTLMILALALGATMLPACVVRGPHGTVAVIPSGHVHSDDCGHYQRRGAWYHHDNHRHGQGCGHTYSGGVWLSVH